MRFSLYHFFPTFFWSVHGGGLNLALSGSDSGQSFLVSNREGFGEPGCPGQVEDAGFTYLVTIGGLDYIIAASRAN